MSNEAIFVKQDWVALLITDLSRTSFTPLYNTKKNYLLHFFFTIFTLLTQGIPEGGIYLELLNIQLVN